MTKDPKNPPESVIEMLLSPATLRRLLESQDDDSQREVFEQTNTHGNTSLSPPFGIQQSIDVTTMTSPNQTETMHLQSLLRFNANPSYV